MAPLACAFGCGGRALVNHADELGLSSWPKPATVEAGGVDPWRFDRHAPHPARNSRASYRAPKQFRHTYAHRMLTAGENLAVISTELGHIDAAVTARVYAGFMAELEGRNFGSLAAEQYQKSADKRSK